MSELPISDLALVGLSPDFKEWIGKGAYSTWVRAAIVARNMDYEKLKQENIDHYSEDKISIVTDYYKVRTEVIQKSKDELLDLLKLKSNTEFVKENSIRNGK